MRLVKTIILAVGVGVFMGCSKTAEPEKRPSSTPAKAQPPVLLPLAEVHFIGTEAMAQDTNNAPFLELWTLPTSVKLTEHLLTRFSETAPALLLGSTNQTEPALKPLLEKALQQEVWFSAQAATDWTLAFQVSGDHLSAWTNGLAEILTTAGASQPAAFTSAGLTGWEVKGGNGGCSVISAKEWLVIQAGTSGKSALAGILETIKTAGRPAPAITNGWLNVSADLAGVLPGTNAARLSLNWSTRAGLVRTRGTLNFSGSAPWVSESWRIPKELIQDPLVSFTAMQGFAQFLNQWELGQKLDWPKEANQFYGWAQDGNPFLATVAMNCNDADTTIRSFGAKLSSYVNQEIVPAGMTPSAISTNDSRFIWPGFPIIVPYIKPAKTSAGDFLVGGIFPLDNTGNTPAPPELFEQVESRTNLVYYNWEITATRLAQWQNTFQLFSMLTSELRFNGKAVGQQWLTEVSPLLGNSVTEISLKSPQELSFTRSSHIGFTSLELVNLIEWIDAKGFPLAEFRLPFQPLGAGTPATPPAP